MRRFIRLKASPRRETFTGTFLIQRREVVAMHTVALTFVRSSAVADDVAQEARRDALRSLDRFEGSPRQQRPYAPEP
jgi:DNA-directed RNA polymerase specialized sigma24 family protein